ncbi:MAG: helix-turn-helix transcriptional regulator [Clostridia bacterium]|nr:helix-turn-helix transcriptional regulator [Clostridia bacterium]MBQ7106503.1 helix-turn-helix transcriptional regulator [Clostridia bacterium]
MEFNEKLQELRKQKGLTQEQLANKLFVSRTAVSKWESGRGYPNIDSLKTIAKLFSVTVDELLSSDELLNLAEQNTRQKQRNLCDNALGLLDCIVSLFLFLPFFAQNQNGNIAAVSLLNLTLSACYIKIIYLCFVTITVIFGVLTLSLQNVSLSFWVKHKTKFSLILSIFGVAIFIIGQQVYAAIFIFAFLIIKSLLLLKK